MRIGVLSDTHGLLRPAVLETLASCDCILHSGDINKPEILETLSHLAP
ncbi:phosphoesterase, family, partial [gut metagenome]